MFKRSATVMAIGFALAAANAAPTITSFTPSVGSPGDLIDIYGTGFYPGVVTVRFFNNRQSTYAGALSETRIQAQVPTGVTTGPITVTVGASSYTSLANFTVIGPGPYLTGFSPGYGAVGDLIVLEGLHLNTATAVRFNGVNAPNFVPNANGTYLNVYVPSGATNGPIVVASSYGNTTSAVPFVVVGPGPYVTGFSPVNGNAGTEVYISGLHLSTVTNVTFDGKSGVNLFPQSDTQIIVNAPEGVTSGPIRVTSPQGSFLTSSNFNGPPVITGFSPTLGRAGTNVMITGANFIGATGVLFGDATASFVVLSNSAIRATVPVGTYSSPVRVNTPGSSFITSTNMRIQPTIAGFTPGNGVPTTVVAISGAALNEGTSAVKFGGLNAAAFTVVGYGQINATAPAGATNAAISVTTSNGTFTSTALFYVPPVITGFSTSNSPAGSLITIFGQNLLGTTAVSFNGTAATFVTPTENTHLEVTVPLGFTTGPISVTTPGGATSSGTKYYGTPSLTGFTPTSGLPGTSVTITGKNLDGASGVLFNGLPAASFGVVNNNTLQAVVPANASTGFIMVFTPAGSVTSTNLFVLNYTADLVLHVLTSTTNAVLGSNLVYTFNLFNDGPHGAPNARITNTLPQNAVLKSYTTTWGTPSIIGNNMVFPLGSMVSGDTRTLTITVEPTATGYITNTARVASDTADPATTNNLVVTRTFVEPVAVLGVQRLAGNQVRLSWPVALTNHHLQQQTNLSGTGNWYDIPTTPVVIGNQNTVTEPMVAPSRYYRLRK
jgi:uncharacterized repeat protein (TIGR01451 family)